MQKIQLLLIILITIIYRFVDNIFSLNILKSVLIQFYIVVLHQTRKYDSLKCQYDPGQFNPDHIIERSDSRTSHVG